MEASRSATALRSITRPPAPISSPLRPIQTSPTWSFFTGQFNSGISSLSHISSRHEMLILYGVLGRFRCYCLLVLLCVLSEVDLVKGRLRVVKAFFKYCFMLCFLVLFLLLLLFELSYSTFTFLLIIFGFLL